MFSFHVYYERSTRTWWGFWMDQNGNQICEAVFSNSRDGVLIELGTILVELDKSKNDKT